MTVEDDLEIRNLVSRYADAVCRRDPQRWAGTWAEDCRWELGAGRVTEGRQATLDLWTTAIAHYPWVVQLVQNGIVEVDGERATGSWYILELNHLADGSAVLHCGNYEDEYVKTVEGWRFAVRRFHLIYRGPMDPGTVVPVVPRPAWTAALGPTPEDGYRTAGSQMPVIVQGGTWNWKARSPRSPAAPGASGSASRRRSTTRVPRS